MKRSKIIKNNELNQTEIKINEFCFIRRLKLNDPYSRVPFKDLHQKTCRLHQVGRTLSYSLDLGCRIISRPSLKLPISLSQSRSQSVS